MQATTRIIKTRINMFFTITTNKKVAEQIKAQCEWDERFNTGRSYELGIITHHQGYSKVQIKAKDGQKIDPEDIFWLGRLSNV